MGLPAAVPGDAVGRVGQDPMAPPTIAGQDHPSPGRAAARRLRSQPLPAVLLLMQESHPPVTRGDMNHAPTLIRPHGGRTVATSAPAKAEDPGRAAPAGQILLVDDDAEIREPIALLLDGAGYCVGCAADGEAAWEALCAARFDLLITDHEMPRLTGVELLRRVRARPLDLPAIMISGLMPWSEPDLKSLLRPGAMMEKPFSMGDLLATVRSFLTPTSFAGEFGAGQTRRTFDRSPLPSPGARAAG